jgi:phosphate transport system permease protein
MYSYYFLALLIFFTSAFLIGSTRARQMVNGQVSHLHSRPAYHGAYLAFLTTLPALALVILWAFVSPALLNHLVFQDFQVELADLSLAQREAFLNDVRTLGLGGVISFSTEMKERAGELYSIYHSYVANALLIIFLLVLAGGFAYGYRRIAPDARNRNRVEKIIMAGLLACSAVAILTTIGIVMSLIFESLRFFQKVPFFDFVFGTHWSPQSAYVGAGAEADVNPEVFGILPLIGGTLLITFIAMSVAAPVGLFSAIYLSDYASLRFRSFAKPLLEILAGIPTVVYGFFAALTVAPFIRNYGESFGLTVSSESALAAGLVMGIMIIPFVSSLSDDVISSVPQALRDGSAGLGATKSETIRKVVLPAALPGIVSALILAFSRAVGETMIVVMAAGLAANLTINPLEAVTTVTVQIVTLLVGDQEFDSAKTLAAFALGLVLFCVTLVLNVFALQIVKRYREQYD